MEQTINAFSPVVASVLAEGFTEHFQFIDGKLVAETQPGRPYSISRLCISPSLCMATRQIVYLVKTADGLRGFALQPFPHDDETVDYSIQEK